MEIVKGSLASLPYVGLEACLDLGGNPLRPHSRRMLGSSSGEGSGGVREVGRKGGRYQEGLSMGWNMGNAKRKGGFVNERGGLSREGEGSGSQGGYAIGFHLMRRLDWHGKELLMLV